LGGQFVQGAFMANGSDHIIGGIATSMLCAYFLRAHITSFHTFVFFLACTVAGSLFPDIDIKSKGQKLFYGLMAPAYIFLFARGQYALCFLVGLCALMPLLSTHRGLFHRWWFVISFASLWCFAFARMFPHNANTISFATLFFVLGALSHLWLDFGLFKMFIR
jgi:hypothetical protein